MEDPLAADGRSEATITFLQVNFSQVKDVVLSPPCMICNLPWKIKILQRADSMQKGLGFFLECNRDSESSSWSCYANARLTILSQKEGIEDFTRNIQHLFSCKESDWGFYNFMSWDDVVNPDKGFIKNDIVIFRAQVIAKASDGTNLDCEKLKSDVVLKNQEKVGDKNLPLQNLSIINRLTKLFCNADSVIVENVTFLQVYLTDLKDATEKQDVNDIEYLLGLIRTRISVMKSLPVVTEWIEEDVKRALELADVEVKNAESILKLNKESPANTSSHRIRIDWKPVPFCGKTDDWCHWWRIFESVIHKNEAIDEEIQMKALAECLKGDADDVLGDMPRTGENYQKAVTLLQNHYGDARILSHTYYNQLERVAQANDLHSQRETVAKLRAIVQNLDALREKFSIDDDVITCNIIQKFPNEVLHGALVSLKSSKQDIMCQPTPAELLGALESYLQMEEFITTHKKKLKPNSVVPVGAIDDHGSED